MPKRQRTEEPPQRVDEDDELSLNSEEETAVAVASGLVSRPQKEGIVNVAGLRQALHELVEPDLPWVERLEVVAAEDLPSIAPDDDLKLELALCV